VGVLDYLLDDHHALSELHRILVPGGLLLLNVRNISPLTSLPHTLKRNLRDIVWGRWFEQRKKVAIQTEWIRKTHGWNYKKYRLKRYEKIVAGYGFTLLRFRTFGFNFTPMKIIGLSFERAGEIERGIERAIHNGGVPLCRYSGMAYIGLFRKS